MSRALLEILDHGRVVPLTVMEPGRPDRQGYFDGGAYYWNGDICDLSRIEKAYHTHKPAPIDSNCLTYFAGQHVYGGMLQNEHFGHFIAENLGRLWALDHLSPLYDSIVFFPRKPKIPVAGFVRQAIELLFPKATITTLISPAEFEVLAVPQDLIKKGYIVGHPLIKRMCRRFELENENGAKRLFVSRSKLSLSDGGILGDRFLDQFMESEGFSIIHPEAMSIRDQLSAYAAAEELVFVEGSALHLYALVCRPTQRVFVVWRRGKYSIFDWQIQSFGGAPLLGEPCIVKLCNCSPR